MKPKKDLYADLGVPKGASTDLIKKTYRRRVKKAHPDVKGSAEQFMTLQFAYDILSDDQLRARYDATGSYESTLKNEELELFVREFTNALQKDPTGNALATTINRFKELIAELDAQMSRLEDLRDKVSQSLHLYHRKDGGENVIAGVLQRQLDAFECGISEGRARRQMAVKAIAIAECYEFRGMKSDDQAAEELM